METKSAGDIQSLWICLSTITRKQLGRENIRNPKNIAMCRNATIDFDGFYFWFADS